MFRMPRTDGSYTTSTAPCLAATGMHTKCARLQQTPTAAGIGGTISRAGCLCGLVTKTLTSSDISEAVLSRDMEWME